MKVQYKDLSGWLKLAAITSFVTFGYYVLAFMYGFMLGFMYGI